MFLHDGLSGGGNIRLFGYQVKAAGRINDFLNRNLGWRDNTRRLCLLQGPTGMGKTYTMGSVIADNHSRDIAFLWLSPAQGTLAVQSYNSLKALLSPKGIAVEYGTADVIAANEALKPHSLTVMNWSLVDKDSNKATKEAEKDNIFDLAAKRSSENVEVVLIVDEAHHAAKNGKKAKAFLSNFADALGYTPVTIEVTATPTSLNEPDAAYPETEIKVVIPVSEVVDAEMIAKGIRVNPGFAEFQSTIPDADSAEAILHAGLAMNQHYRDLLAVDPMATTYKNPLLLVQVPNGAQGKQYIEIIERICATYGITEESHRLGKYLSEGKSDEDKLKAIASADSPIEVLIFKQGIALGWDCPRAKGLVAYRESKNDIFRVQTVGRIVRMPEHRHYENDVLNRAFIFTNLEDSMFDFSNSGTGTGYLSDRTLTVREGVVTPADMPTSNWSRSGFQGNVTAERLDAGLKDPAAVAALAAVAPNMETIQATAVVTENVLTDVDIQVDAVFGESSKTSGKTADFAVSDASLDPLFKAALAEILPMPYTNVSRSVATFLPRYIEWVVQAAPSLKRVGASQRKRQAIVSFLASAEVREAWKAVLEVCAAAEPTKVTRKLQDWENYSFPMILPASSDKGEPVASVVGDLADTYLYVDGKGVAFLESKPSAPERAFMEKILVGLKNKGRLVWWWKNGESGTSDTTPYFRIPHVKYRDGENNRLYPDYVVCFLDSEGKERVAVLEVKDGGSGKLSAFNEDSRMKAATLGDWAANKTGGVYVAGLVYLDAMSKKWKFADTDDKADDRLLDDVLA